MFAIETKNVFKYIELNGICPKLFSKEHSISEDKASDILNTVASGKVNGELILLD